jgi:putative redox protein
MTLTATAQRVGGGLRQEIDVNGRHTIVTDEPASLGGTDAGPAPHELLPAALAGCIATTIAMYAQRHQWEIGEPRVHVEYDKGSEPRRLDITIELPSSLSDDQLRRLERVAETCPLRRSLETGFTFEERIVTAAPALA